MRAPLHDLHGSHAVTYLSLGCGVLAIGAANQTGADGSGAHVAGALIALAALADTYDGRFARRFTRTPRQTEIGGHLDSLVDACVFGIAPIAVLAAVASPSGGTAAVVWWAAAVAYALCAVTRLAFFNVTHDTGGFVGLPTPAVALVWSTLLALRTPSPIVAAAFVTLGLAMVAPFPIPRPRGVALGLFAGWAVGLIGLHTMLLK